MSRKPIVLEDGTEKLLRAKHYNQRLKLALGALTLLGILVTSLYFYNIWNKENKAIERRLETFTELRHSTLSRFVNSLAKETELWASHQSTIQEAGKYFDIWDRLPPNDRKSLQDEYIGNQPNTKASDMYNAYKAHHAKHNKNRAAFMHHHGYYDVFYFNLNGDLVYTVEKEVDYGQNFVTGPLANSGLGQVFRAARDRVSGTSVFYDYAPYSPSDNVPASFLAAPMQNTHGEKIGVYAIQVSVEKLDSILQYSSGLGKTGETYVVGQDYLMRNNSRLSSESTLLIKTMDTPAIRAALNGKTILSKNRNSNGNKTLIAAEPLEFSGIKWAVATEMELSELRAPLTPYFWFYLMTLVFVLLFGFVQYWLLKKRTSA